eukprot:scaffold361554_cov24-Prasinocladus_malaysianus.AAC.1
MQPLRAPWQAQPRPPPVMARPTLKHTNLILRDAKEKAKQRVREEIYINITEHGDDVDVGDKQNAQKCTACAWKRR